MWNKMKVAITPGAYHAIYTDYMVRAGITPMMPVAQKQHLLSETFNLTHHTRTPDIRDVKMWQYGDVA
jgi:hypothetical protein